MDPLAVHVWAQGVPEMWPGLVLEPFAAFRAALAKMYPEIAPAEWAALGPDALVASIAKRFPERKPPGPPPSFAALAERPGVDVVQLSWWRTARNVALGIVQGGRIAPEPTNMALEAASADVRARADVLLGMWDPTFGRPLTAVADDLRGLGRTGEIGWGEAAAAAALAALDALDRGEPARTNLCLAAIAALTPPYAGSERALGDFVRGRHSQIRH